jgi:polyvinyl alcohol dehydrogenase (cytochrome)
MKKLKSCFSALLALAVFSQIATGESAVTEAAEATGAQLYELHCNHCHGGSVSKAPQLSLLQIMSPGSVFRALESGVMQEQAAALSSLERQLIAEHLTGAALSSQKDFPLPQVCEGKAAQFDWSAQPDLAGWGVDLGNQRNFDDTITQLSAGDLPKLKLKWAFAYPDAVRARSQPATAGGSVFVGSQNGSVFSLDQATGCLRWVFSTVAEVRTGIVVGSWSDGADRSALLYFGDLVGNVYALNALTGELIWRDRPDNHPSLTLTAAPALHDGRLYVPLSSLEVTAAADPNYACCTFRGGVAVYDARSGEKLWTGYTIDQKPRKVGENAVGTARIAPSGSPIWNTPALDPARSAMYVGTGENYSSPANDTSDAVLALSMKDGRILWRQQMTAGDAWNMGCETAEKINCPPENGPDYDFGAAVILAKSAAGKEVLIAGQKSGDVYGLDPDKNGEVIWHRKLGRGGIQGGVHFGMSAREGVVYVPMSDFDGGPRWPGVARPGLYALDVGTGELKWSAPATDVCEGREFCQPGLSAPASSLKGGVIAGAMDGHIRGYDGASGKVLWDFDSSKSFSTVNGIKVNGGSIGGGSGPVLKGNRLFINSGYGIYFHMPGSVLLVFEALP